MSALPEPLAKLSVAEKRALLEKMLREKLSRPKAVALSFAQQRLWFLDQLDPGAATYNIPSAVRLRGRLDVNALLQSLAEIVRRHAILRTTFAIVDGQPVQIVSPTLDLPLPLIDLTGWLDEDRELELQHQLTLEGRRPFDLARGPLLRHSLFRLAETDHVLILTMHHIVTDGWSTGILFRDLTVLYAAFASGKPSPLPGLPVQYADFAVWQQQQMQAAETGEHLDYWTRQLGGDLPVLELPTDWPRSRLPSARGAVHTFRLSKALTEAVKHLSQRENATLFMTLFAAFQLLLYHYTGQRDIVVGTPIANRGRGELEGLIGFFVNTLALRTQLQPGESFRQLLQRVRRAALDAYAHQDLPFEKLVEALQPERSLDRTPLFQVMFGLHNTPLPRGVEAGDLKLEFVRVKTATSEFDLELALIEGAEAIQGELTYNSTLFQAATMARMMTHFDCLLESIVAAPDRSISALPLLTPPEQRQLLVDWNATGVDFTGPENFIQCFYTQVAQTPEAIAATSETPGGLHAHLTYAALGRRADRAARRLDGLGLGPERLVALLAPRGLDFLTLVLAAFQTGGAYLPLDPHHPPQRHTHILRQSAASLVVVADEFQETLAAALADLPAGQRPGVLLAADLCAPSLQAGDPGGDPFPAPLPAHLAYVIYTSGSTGLPKGAMVEQRGMLNHLHAKVRDLALTRVDVIAQTASQCFDISVWQFLAALLVGGRTHIVPDEVALDPARLSIEVERAEVTILETVPSMLRAMLEAAAPGPALRALRWLIPTGEALPPELARQWFARYPTIPVMNAYGPTECSDDVTHYAVRQPPAADLAHMPIGRPVANMKMYVLDPQWRPVPVGVAGELYVGGVGVGRGYLHAPDQTAGAFVPDGFAEQPGMRLYKTGDRVRWRTDGNLDFLGRVDFQVKLRGFRIELGEIEAALTRHPEVRETLVMVEQAAPGGDRSRPSAVRVLHEADARLVAYVVRVPSSAVAAGELRKFLQAQLPDYMTPSAFVFLEAMPLTPNGKIDRRALRRSAVPDHDPALSETAHVAPRTPVEEVLAGMWAQVLGHERISVTGNFFDLGGHSLLATQIVSRIRESFGVEVPIRRFFEAPTVAGMAEHLESTLHKARGLRRPPVLPAAEGSQPLSFAQERLWFLDQLAPASPVYNIPTAMRLTGALNLVALEQSVTEVVRRHRTLRTTFVAVDGQPVLRVAPPAHRSIPVVDLRQMSRPACEAEAIRLADEEARCPFDLTAGPLLRVRLLWLEAADYVVLVTLHHIVSDGWSMGLLIEELTTFYNDFVNGRAASLPEPHIHYSDFAAWQRQWLQAEGVLETQLGYWRGQLAGAPAALELPPDHPRPAVPGYRGGVRPFHFSSALLDALKALSRREGVTLFMTLLAAFQALLSRYTGQDDILVGTPIANRNLAETERLIGFFVNTLVLRTHLDGADLTFRQLLRRVRDVCLDAYTHQDLPFEKLVEELRPDRELNRPPLFQVLFVLQNAPLVSRELPGLTMRSFPITNNTTKFDLTLSLLETSAGLVGGMEYNADLFEPATVDRWLAHFQTLLEGIVAAPEQRAAELPLFTDAERHRLLTAWNDTARFDPPARCLHERFEAQAAQTPDARAVVFAAPAPEAGLDGQLTYHELNRRANRLAHHLRSLGVGPDVLVGLHVERSLEMVIGLLGILKAGGAYVPLDPASPPERLAFMIEDTRAPVIVAQSHLARRLPPHTAHLVCLAADEAPLASENDANPVSQTALENVAYVIYTSGSTGRPKGVLVEHRQVLNYHRAILDRLAVTSGESFAMVQPLTVDSCKTVIFSALCSGGCLHVVAEGLSADPDGLGDYFEREPIDCLKIAPSHLSALHAASPQRPIMPGRWLIVGGEASRREWVRKMQAFATGCVIFNHYGPTEATVGMLMYRVDPESDDDRAVVPMGRPLPNTRAYLLDRFLQPVPVGVPGELYIGGACVTRGYLNRPDLTAERFIPDPFAPTPASSPFVTRSVQMEEGGAERRVGETRLYKTGDLARWLPEGNIEFLGRLDHQIKIRGYRIETGEIETALGGHPSVLETLVVPHEDAPGEVRLVAYVVADPEKPPALSDLRQWLQAKLPDYMIPQAFVHLPALPRTPHGKINRRALPAPESTRPELAAAYVAPQTEVEQTLAGIWQDVLHVERVGVHDNFFELGGHSLLLVRVHSRVRELFGAQVTLLDLFRYPTISTLSRYLRVGDNPTSAVQQDFTHGEKRREALKRQKENRRKQRAAAKKPFINSEDDR